MASGTSDRTPQTVLLCNLKVIDEYEQQTRLSAQAFQVRAHLPIAQIRLWSLLVNQGMSKSKLISLMTLERSQQSRRKKLKAEQKFSITLSIGTEGTKKLLKPIMGSTTEDVYIELKGNGVIHRRVGQPITTTEVPKMLTVAEGGWFVILGRNGVYLVDVGSAAICCEPLFIQKPNGQILALLSGTQVIVLGTGGHMLLSAVGVTLLIVGIGGFNENELNNSFAPINRPYQIFLRAYKGLTAAQQPLPFYLLQVKANFLFVDDNNVYFRGNNCLLLLYSLLGLFDNPHFTVGSQRINGRFVSLTNALDLGPIPAFDTAHIDQYGNITDAQNFQPLNDSRYVRVMPWSGSIVVVSWNGSLAQIRSGLDSCLWLRLGIVMALSSARNATDTTEHIKAILPNNTIFLNSGHSHWCFATPNGSLLLSGDDRFNIAL